MLFLHELHDVDGAHEEAFDDAVRDGWMPALARDEDARLLYVLRQAHGTGLSYRMVTITAIRDGAAWDRLAQRIERGDLAGWASKVDTLRHEVWARMLVPLPWSPLQNVELSSVPTEAREHEMTVFMEDTVWPYEGKLDDYIERSGSHYAKEMKSATEVGPRLLTVDASFRTALGSHRRREVVLWQKVVRPEGLIGLFTREVPPQYTKPGMWMHDALSLRDQWQSRLLRTVSWSPWY